MNRVLTSGIAALGFLCAALAAAPAHAQEEQDKITKFDKSGPGGISSVTGTIKSEDLTGCLVAVAKGAEITIRWKDIKSIDYAGSPDFKRAKGYVDAGSTDEAMKALEELRKKADLRAILKPHVLNLLGASYARSGMFDKAIDAYTELFKQFPKTQLLIVGGGGENLIDCYLAKGGAAAAKDAQAALETLFNGVKSVGGDTTPLNVLRGRALEATGDFVGAASAYKLVADATTSDDATKAAAELGIARCLAGQKKAGEAEAAYRKLVARDVPALVLAGAWNGLGDVALANGRANKDAAAAGESVFNALLDYLRGCVLYTPSAGEPTTEYERAVRGAYDCFTALSELEKDEKKKTRYRQCANERKEYLQTKFPNSVYIPGK
jgi:tetratricopeptide (TPR) repeat protein